MFVDIRNTKFRLEYLQILLLLSEIQGSGGLSDYNFSE